jgi:hypothetical protein
MEREHLRNDGARRVSHVIKRLPAVNIHHARRYAERIGLPLQLFVTINFTLLGVPPDAAVLLFRTVLAQRFAPWLRRTSESNRHIPPTYVWVMEAAGGQMAVHWLVHMPAKMRWSFKRKVIDWLEEAAGHSPPERAFNLKPIKNIVGLGRYILKGTDAPWAKHLGVVHVPQGRVVGKRSGFSKNLGPTARKRGGYKPQRVPPRASAA